MVVQGLGANQWTRCFGMVQAFPDHFARHVDNALKHEIQVVIDLKTDGFILASLE